MSKRPEPDEYEVIKIAKDYIKELSEKDPRDIAREYHKHTATLLQRVDSYLLRIGFITNPNYRDEPLGYNEDIFDLHELAVVIFNKHLNQRLERLRKT